MERFLPLVYIVGWFGLVFGASYLINWLLVRSIVRRFYRWFVAPGVMVHELSHAVGCLATGSPITEINFWKASGGHVKHLQPNDPFRRMINDPIIALAPIWGTFLVLAAITWFLMPDLFVVLTSGDAESLLTVFDPTSWLTWVYLYLVISLVATIAPSKTDMRYAFGSLVVISLFLIFALLLPGVEEYLLDIGEKLRPAALFTIGLLAVALALSFLLALPVKNRQYSPREQIE